MQIIFEAQSVIGSLVVALESWQCDMGRQGQENEHRSSRATYFSLSVTKND